MTAASPLHPAWGTARLASVARRLANTPELWCDLVEHVAGERRFARLPVGVAAATDLDGGFRAWGRRSPDHVTRSARR